MSEALNQASSSKDGSAVGCPGKKMSFSAQLSEYVMQGTKGIIQAIELPLKVVLAFWRSFRAELAADVAAGSKLNK